MATYKLKSGKIVTEGDGQLLSAVEHAQIQSGHATLIEAHASAAPAPPVDPLANLKAEVAAEEAKLAAESSTEDSSEAK
jgi:hypothetical protein